MFRLIGGLACRQSAAFHNQLRCLSCDACAMTRVPLSAVLLLLVSSVLAGCGLTALNDRRDDNPKIRALQAASVSHFGDRPIAGRSIDAFFRDKVGLIALNGEALPIGRATPISPDGYYLTARHVAEEGDFRLSVAISQDNPFRVAECPGRVVWQDRAADLAVVKFDYRPGHVFSPRQMPLHAGEAVFSGAGGLNSGVRFAPRNPSGVYNISDLMRESFGNGDYRTAGKVTRLRVINKRPLRRIYESTLVGRGGMSGGPVVDDKGHLAGVITSGQARLFASPLTTFSMLDLTVLESILQGDRSRRQPGSRRPREPDATWLPAR